MVVVYKKKHLSGNVLYYALILWKPTYLFLLDTIPHTASDLSLKKIVDALSKTNLKSSKADFIWCFNKLLKI